MLDAKTCAIAAKVLRDHAGDLLRRNAGIGRVPGSSPARAEQMADNRSIAEACIAVADAITEAR